MLKKLGITPGPWVEDTGFFYSEVQLNTSGTTEEEPIAEMVGGRDKDYEANARLIAAAPELLEALIKVATLAEKTLRWVSDKYKIDSENANKHQLYLKSIIEKATGKSWKEIKRLQEE